VLVVIWGATATFALSDRDAIFTYIEAENPSAAILVDERIVAGVRRLVDFPASGRVGRIAGTRELVINGTNQRVGGSNFFKAKKSVRHSPASAERRLRALMHEPASREGARGEVGVII